MNAIIFYEHLVREWKAVSSLKKELEGQGFRVKAYSLIFQRTAAWLDAIFHRPDVIFLPWYIHEGHEQILDPIVRLAPNVILINQHQEQIGSPASEVSLYPITDSAKNGCYHFAWGDHFKDLLIRCGVREDLIYVTGNVRNDATQGSTVTKADLAAEFGLDVNKKWVLFAENRGWLLQRNNEGTIQELLHTGSTREHIDYELAYSRESLDAFFDEVRNLGDSFGKEYEFIYRPHPGTQLQPDFPAYAHVISNRPILDWIMNCDLYLTCESTSIFEAEMCGVPCATFDKLVRPAEVRMAGVHDYPKLNTLKEISDELIQRLALEQKARQPIYERYLGKVDGKACQRTVEATMEIMQKERIPNLLVNKSTFFGNFYHFSYEVMTFIVTKLGIMDKLRFPKTAYTEARDIPYSSVNKWMHE